MVSPPGPGALYELRRGDNEYELIYKEEPSV